MISKKEKLKEELDWRLRVFDSLSYPTLILRTDMVIISANHVFLKEFGVELEELEGRSCYNFFYQLGKSCPTSVCPFPKVMAQKKGSSILKKVTRNGRFKWEDRVFSPILDDDGEVAYIIESIRDVTKFKSLEKELTGIKEFVERVVQSSVSAIVAADRNGKIILMNQAAEELFGYTTWDILNKKTAEDLYPKGKAKEIMSKLRDEKNGGKGKLPSTNISILNSDGEEIPVEITAAIIYNEHNREIATMGIYNDLRERLAVEEKLRKAQDRLIQSEKLASIGQLAAGVAHEINNPLTGILFYANLMLEKMNENDPDREGMTYIIEDVNRCKNIVKNLLAYSRQASSDKRVVQINELVEQSLMLIRDQKLFRNIKIVKEMGDEVMMTEIDINHLNQAIINLVMNAVAAMGNKGVLTFRTYRNKAEKKIFLEIADTGHGIPDEIISKIFDPFFTTKEPGKGTGLGLSTAYGIVKENGGGVRIKETSPEGTTFLVELPLFIAEENV